MSEKKPYSERFYPKNLFEPLDDAIRKMVDAAYSEGYEDGVKETGVPWIPQTLNPPAGACGKCGAPYTYPSGPWMSIIPPTPVPSCNCWNVQTVSTMHTGTSTGMPPPGGKE